MRAEGSFAKIKQDMNFGIFMCREQKNVLAESIFLSMAHNVNKLHSKIHEDRAGKHLFELKKYHIYKILLKIIKGAIANGF